MTHQRNETPEPLAAPQLLEFPRFRLSSLETGRLDHFETMGGLRAWMNADGSGEMLIVGKDSAGRRKSISAEMSADDMLRLHHTLGEALKVRSAYLPLAPRPTV